MAGVAVVLDLRPRSAGERQGGDERSGPQGLRRSRDARERGVATLPVLVEVKREPGENERGERGQDGGRDGAAAGAALGARGVWSRASGAWKREQPLACSRAPSLPGALCGGRGSACTRRTRRGSLPEAHLPDGEDARPASRSLTRSDAGRGSRPHCARGKGAVARPPPGLRTPRARGRVSLRDGECLLLPAALRRSLSKTCH